MADPVNGKIGAQDADTALEAEIAKDAETALDEETEKDALTA